MNELRTEKGGKRERHASVGWTTAAPTATEDPWPKRLFCRPSPAVAAGRAAALQGRGRRGAGGQVAGGRAGAEAAGAGGGAGWGRAALVAAVCRPRGRHRRVGDTGHRRAPTPHHNRGGGGEPPSGNCHRTGGTESWVNWERRLGFGHDMTLVGHDGLGALAGGMYRDQDGLGTLGVSRGGDVDSSRGMEVPPPSSLDWA